MPMVKDYLYNAFKHGIDAGKLQYGVGQELASAQVVSVAMQIILSAKLKKFASFRRLKANSVMNTSTILSKSPGSAQFSWDRLTWLSIWVTDSIFSTPKLQTRWTI